MCVSVCVAYVCVCMCMGVCSVCVSESMHARTVHIYVLYVCRH